MMRRTLVVLVLSCLLLPASLRAQGAADSVRALDSAWARAYATHDTALALALYDEHVVVTGGTGAAKTRAEELKDVGPYPGLTLHFFRSSDADVAVHGNTAVVTAIADWQYTMNQRTSDTRRWYTAVYERGGPLGWRIVVLHLRPAALPALPAHTAHRHPAGARILIYGAVRGTQPELLAADSTRYLLSAAPKSTVWPEVRELSGQQARLMGTVYPTGNTYLIVVDSARATTP